MLEKFSQNLPIQNFSEISLKFPQYSRIHTNFFKIFDSLFLKLFPKIRASVLKLSCNLLKISKFPGPYFFKLFSKFSDFIQNFLKFNRFIIFLTFTCNFQLHYGFLKLFSKCRKHPLKSSIFKFFSHFLQILSEFSNIRCINFFKIFNSLFSQSNSKMLEKFP